jgi:predicted RNA binding protein YcfA (HicA-like mRNA interferase family)
MKKGSHEFWINNEKNKVINVNRTNGTYPIKTLETMIAQSGIPKKEWFT